MQRCIMAVDGTVVAHFHGNHYKQSIAAKTFEGSLNKLFKTNDSVTILRSMKTQSSPREIRRLDSKGLRISWQDDVVQELSSEILRRNCPCAGCRELRGDDSHSKPLTGKKRSLAIVQNTVSEELSLEEVWGVGQYAIGIRWGDGHSSGIYTFPYLRELGASSPLPLT